MIYSTWEMKAQDSLYSERGRGVCVCVCEGDGGEQKVHGMWKVNFADAWEVLRKSCCCQNK